MKDNKDFLNQFNGSGYKGKDSTKQEHKEPKIILNQSQGNKKIASPEHIIERDNSYHKRKLMRHGIIGGSILAACLILFLIFRLMNRVELKDFVGTTIGDAKTWGLSNKVTLEIETVFNVEFDEDLIIEQNKEPKSHIQKGSVLKLKVSKGADPEEHIELPDFESMKSAEIHAWRQELKAFSVNVNEEFNEEIEKGRFIKKEFTSNEVNEGNYTRGDGLLIYVSKGEEVFEKNIVVPDFSEKLKPEIQSWAKTNDIELIIEEKASNTIITDGVISQSIEAGTKIAKKDTLTIVFSQGRSVVVPNFNGLTMEEGESFPGLAVMGRRKYSSQISYGRVISQSEEAGAELLGEEAAVTVVYSLGKPYIDDLTGESEKTLAEYFYELTSRGVDVSYSIHYVDSAEPKGTIVSMSKYAEFLSMSDHVNVYVSRGNIQRPVEREPELSEPVTPQPTERVAPKPIEAVQPKLEESEQPNPTDPEESKESVSDEQEN